MPEKTCLLCNESKKVTDFPLDPVRKDGRYPWCKPCKAAYMRGNKARLQRETYEWQTRLERRYGVRWETIVATYGDSCNICGDSKPAQGRFRLNVDHDHETGKIRGVLCSSCNLGLGKFKDDLKLLKAAVKYIQTSPLI